MLEVKLLHKDDPSIEIQWKSILIESFNHSYKANGYKEDIERHRLDMFWETINKEAVYIVIRQNKAVGFFFIEGEGFKLFMYPRACPMSLRSILKCALFKIMEMSLEDSSIQMIKFNTWHPSLVSLVKTYLPTAKITTYSPTDYECVYTITEQDKEKGFPSILSKNTSHYNAKRN